MEVTVTAPSAHGTEYTRHGVRTAHNNLGQQLKRRHIQAFQIQLPSQLHSNFCDSNLFNFVQIPGEQKGFFSRIEWGC